MLVNAIILNYEELTGETNLVRINAVTFARTPIFVGFAHTLQRKDGLIK